jgi:hypothetical protein
LGLNAGHLLHLEHPKLIRLYADCCKKKDPTEIGLSMPWSAEAEASLEKIPSFIRQQAIRKIEQIAKENNFEEVTPDVMDRARKA